MAEILAWAYCSIRPLRGDTEGMYQASGSAVQWDAVYWIRRQSDGQTYS